MCWKPSSTKKTLYGAKRYTKNFVMGGQQMMQWPPVHGGPVYWFIRHRLLKAKSLRERTLRIVRENYDRQRVKNLMEPRISYDYRINQWTQKLKKKGGQGIVSVLGVRIRQYVLRPLFATIWIWWLMHELWKQEKHPIQSYMMWRKTHMEEAARRQDEDDED